MNISDKIYLKMPKTTEQLKSKLNKKDEFETRLKILDDK